MYRNRVMIIGRVVAVPEFRQITDKQSLTKIRVAANTYRGEGLSTKPLYVDCIMYNRTLPNNHRIDVGALVCVEGELEIAQWQQTNGQKCSKPQIRLASDSPLFLAESPKKNGNCKNPEASLSPQVGASEKCLKAQIDGISSKLTAACPYEASIVCPKLQNSIEQANLNNEFSRRLTAETADNENNTCKDIGRSKVKTQTRRKRRTKK